MPCPQLFVLATILALSSTAAAQPRTRSASDFIRDHGFIELPKAPPTQAVSGTKQGYQVNDTKSFWTWDLSDMPPRDVLVPATCRAVGDHHYLFVANNQWESSVDADDVTAITAALESNTPAGSINSDQGIFANEIEVFGAIPDALDGDSRVFVLLMELASYGGNQFDGYFNVYNQYTDAYSVANFGYHSNEVEMITVNSVIRPVADEMTLSILAHELQHLIHWGGDTDEVSWVNESCSEAAMTLNGYDTDIDWLNSYIDDPSVQLYIDDYVHYGACLLFGSYLYERFGADFLTAVVADPGNGEAGFAAPLAALAEPVTMDELLLDWATATVGDYLGATDPRWGHALLHVGVPAFEHSVGVYPTPTPRAGTLPGTGVGYVRLIAPAAGDEDVQVTVASDYPERLAWRGILVDGNGDAEISEPDQGQITVNFAGHPDADKAVVVLLALDGPDADYSLTAEIVPGQPPTGGSGGDGGGGGTDGVGGTGGTGGGEDDPPGGGCAAGPGSAFVGLFLLLGWGKRLYRRRR